MTAGQDAAAVTLREITIDTVRAVCELELAPGQEAYVAPAAFTAAEGAYDPEAWTPAVHLGETVVGVLLVLFTEPARPRLVRFMVGAPWQRRGIGRRALALAAEHARERGARELRVSHRRGPGEPGGFYRACGFAETGEEDRGEPLLRLALQPGAAVSPR